MKLLEYFIENLKSKEPVYVYKLIFEENNIPDISIKPIQAEIQVNNLRFLQSQLNDYKSLIKKGNYNKEIMDEKLTTRIKTGITIKLVNEVILNNGDLDDIQLFKSLKEAQTDLSNRLNINAN